MATVSKDIADDIIAGKYDSDGCHIIVKYTNAWGSESYGACFHGEANKYTASQYVRNPSIYWEKK